MRIRRVYDSRSDIVGKYRLELEVGWRSIPLTGFWFERWKNAIPNSK